ncbi:MAG: FAD-binding oxidoreductase [Prevotellaceae bacterium]|jgi:D-lactate dehydrogenase|nr:FAD-binding oxidoreductase [Prevotellaceae bacterium]
MAQSTNVEQFLSTIREFIPSDRIYTDELRRLAWGTDAGFYRLIPQLVVRSIDEEEVSRLLEMADAFRVSVTFRAAGTSLSGQAITDSVMIVAGKHWERYWIAPDAKSITLQPGIIGARVNEILKPYGRKFSPDPASINSAMVGGIVINNSSGMNCGTHANSDKELLSARIVLADGTLLDTGSADSRNEFMQTHPELIKGICELRERICGDEKLVKRIRYKYSIKNVTGLNMLPFVRFDDPFDIITHLMVGSEGTLAFLSEVTMKTEYDYPYHASAMIYFDDIREACRAVVAMKKLVNEGDWIVKGAELLDHKSLESVDDRTGRDLTAVLTEVMGASREELQTYIETVTSAMKAFKTYIPVRFTEDPSEYGKYWAMRSGIFPSVGAMRQLGTTTLIEDVAFHIDVLPEATADLQALMVKHGYDDACIYGHALEGNYHFIINQSFSSDDEVKRYENMMRDVVKLVVEKYDGSLKAEHGTGRNMAPFVSYEWGEKIYGLMKEVKALFDPYNLLNPGVIFNEDPQCFLKHFKPLPLTNPQVDKCIECGFCEINCLTCGFALSSRQRIVTQREITRLQEIGEDSERLDALRKQYTYWGNQTCAGDGLCSTSCPMKINTGILTHALRAESLPHNSSGYKAGAWTAKHFVGIKRGLRLVLTMADAAHTVLGTPAMTVITKGMHQMGIPLWTASMPKPYRVNKVRLLASYHTEKKQKDTAKETEQSRKVVYFPSCINQTMGLAKHSPVEMPLVNKMVSLLHKGGYEVIFPDGMEKLCCGTIWESKGMPDVAYKKAKELEDALWVASEEGKYPVLCDQSPCLHRMRETIKKMKLYEPAEFISVFLADRLVFEPTDTPVAVHVTCSMRLMGLADTIVDLAKRCSKHVLVPEEVGCCGFAGDRGFLHPEVNAYALRKLRPQIEAENIQIGYSNSRTCEIGLATNSGIPYVSIAYLVDSCTKPFSNIQKP